MIHRENERSEHQKIRGAAYTLTIEEHPQAKQIPHALEPALLGPDATRDAVPIARDGERALPDARRQGQRRAKGQ
jgi:hypothetical protein